MTIVNTNAQLQKNLEVISAKSFAESLKKFRIRSVSFSNLSLELLKNTDILWFHRPDSSDFKSEEINLKVVQTIKNYLTKGGKLLLTLDAIRYLKPLGLEEKEPTTNYSNAIDEGYGRKLGLHSFREHPIFEGMFGGAYIWNPDKDMTCRLVGYFDDSIPVGKVVAVNWAYIMLYENQKLVLEHEIGKGKILSIGAYTYFNLKNNNSMHLELFMKNCFDYLLGKFDQKSRFYWEYDSLKVTQFEINSIDDLNFVKSKTWKENDESLKLRYQFASNDFWDLAGQRILIMGKEKSGIDEVWIHPFMTLRDYEVGVKFSYRDTIYWFNDQIPQIEIRPESISRTYQFARAFIKEVITYDVENPIGIIHYEYRGVYPAEMIIKFKSNLRFMWPYSENVFREMKYSFNQELNAFIIKDRSGDFNSIIGVNKNLNFNLVDRYDGFVKAEKNFEGIATDKFQISGLMKFDVAMNDNFEIVFAGTDEGTEKAITFFKKGIQKAEEIYKNTTAYNQNVLTKNLMITTPDKDFNEGYRWALIGTDRFFVNTPTIGKSLVAGYSTTATGWDGGHKVNGRPGYGWYFGRDGVWSGFALCGYGDFEKVKSMLETFQKYQDLSGKIFHELTTSGAVHYDASDSTPLYLILAGYYLRVSGDLDFIRSSWNHIKKAIDYCFSTDTDGDHLIENTLVGHGWVEGGGLYTAHTEAYLAGCWAKALEEVGFIAEKLGYSKESKFYLSKSQKVKEILNTDFWNYENQFLSFSKLKDGSFNNEKTVLPAVPIYFELIDKQKAEKVIDAYAENYFSSDWGVRILREDSPIFNPRGYHTGSVWPLFTGWTALAEYKYGNHNQGFTHIMNNLLTYKNWAKGFVPEVLHGAEYRMSGVCPHQCWSQTMVLQPIIEGMLGLKINAFENSISLQPAFPINWDFVKVDN
ncbi:MAG: GH116 family glycosyl hydrolase, partial [Ignavibacteria bacterium]|nr:GH116 family glycosyl hydrolase [Ignavibacteria bacterium]